MSEEVNPVRMLERIPPREWRDLGIAWFAITLAFTVVFLRDGVTVPGFLLVFGASALTVGTGFILHELAHKFAAISYGYWAEFQRDNLMLVVAVAMAALAGVVFAAPGATVIYGSNLSRRENGRISASGPATNLLLIVPFVALALLGGGLLSIIGVMGWKVNAMLASFNMLPVGPLDGKKVLAWNPGIFAALIGAAFVLLYVSFFPSILTSFIPGLR
jgi:Zn-dependent protease